MDYDYFQPHDLQIWKTKGLISYQWYRNHGSDTSAYDALFNLVQKFVKLFYSLKINLTNCHPEDNLKS